MSALAEFSQILLPDAPLGAHTCFGVGGPAQWLATPRDVDELARLVQRCSASGLPVRIFGGGSNLLVPDEGVKGVVVRTACPALQQIQTQKTRVSAGAGASLAELIAHTCKTSASGLEVLAGIPGTVGGAVRNNAGARTGDIGQFIHSVDVMDETGAIATRQRADIRFGYRHSNLDDVIILAATFDLVEDNPDDIMRRIKKIWIAKKAVQPFEFQAAGYVFKNPRGLSAVELIEKSGLRGAKVGGAELSDRDPKFVIANPGAASRDIRRLIDLVRNKVAERTGVALELQIDLW